MTDNLAARRSQFRSLATDIANAHNLTIGEILSTCRATHIVRVRHMIWLQAREKFGWSFPMIAYFTRRDHSTVMHGIQQARKRIAAGAA